MISLNISSEVPLSADSSRFIFPSSEPAITALKNRWTKRTIPQYQSSTSSQVFNDAHQAKRLREAAAVVSKSCGFGLFATVMYHGDSDTESMRLRMEYNVDDNGQ